MTHIEDSKQLKEVFLLNQSPYFSLYRSGGFTPVLKNVKEGDLTKAFKILEDGFKLYGSGRYDIELRSSPNQSRGVVKLDFTHGSQPTPQIAGVQPAYDVQTLRDYMDTSLEKQRLEMRLDRMEEENKELRKNQRQGFDIQSVTKVIEGVAPVIGRMLGFPMPMQLRTQPFQQPQQPQPVQEQRAAVGFNTQTEPQEEDEDRYSPILNRIFTALQCKDEAEFINYLTKFAVFAEKNPMTVKPMLANLQ